MSARWTRPGSEAAPSTTLARFPAAGRRIPRDHGHTTKRGAEVAEHNVAAGLHIATARKTTFATGSPSSRQFLTLGMRFFGGICSDATQGDGADHSQWSYA